MDEKIKQDREGKGWWWIPKGSGKGTEDEPHIHETIHIDADGNILPDSHTTIVVGKKKIRINYNNED